MGFAVPIGAWLRQELRPLVSEYVLGTAARHDLFDPQVVQKWNTEHGSGIRNRTTELWGILIFNMWYDHFVGRRSAAGARDVALGEASANVASV
jgi:asparagine synthase (glutamine-hydrolysing)